MLSLLCPLAPGLAARTQGRLRVELRDAPEDMHPTLLNTTSVAAAPSSGAVAFEVCMAPRPKERPNSVAVCVRPFRCAGRRVPLLNCASAVDTAGLLSPHLRAQSGAQ